MHQKSINYKDEHEPFQQRQFSDSFQSNHIIIRSLNDFRSQISKYVQYTDMRKKMVELFIGTSDDLWFIQELLDNLNTIFLYNSGSLFINEICQKLAFSIPEWNDYMIQNADLVLSSDDGPQIFITLFSKMDDFQKTELSNTIFTNFLKWADSDFRIPNLHNRIQNFTYHQNLIKILFKKLIIFSREQEIYFKPLLLIDYFANPKYMFILELLIEETNYSAATKIVLDNFDYCLKNTDFIGLLIYLYLYKDESIKQFIFDQLVSKHKQSFMKEPQWKLFRAIALDGNMNHCEGIASILESHLNQKLYPQFFEHLIIPIIFSLPYNSRMEFFKRNQNELLPFAKYPNFSMLLQYIEVLFE